MPELTGQQIYEAMTVYANGTGSINTGIAAISRIRNALSGVQDRLRSAETRMAGSWKGNAADAAVAAAKPIWASMDDTVDKLNKHEHSLRDQGSQFTLNSNQLRPVTTPGPVGDDGQPLEKSWWDSIVPWDTDTDDKINAYNANANFNKAKFNEYKGATDNNTRDLPASYENAPDGGSPVTVIGGTVTGGVHGPTHRPPKPSGGGGPVSSSGGRQGGTQAGPRGGTAGGTGGQGGETPHAGPTPPPAGPPPEPGHYSPISGAATPPAHDYTAAADSPGTTSAAAATGSRTGDIVGATRRVVGAAPVALGGYRNGGEDDVRRQPGACSGTGREVVTAQEPLSPAAQRGSGAGTPGMLGGQGTRREKDTERTVPAYLISEDNGNAIVGELPSTAPRVIE